MAFKHSNSMRALWVGVALCAVPAVALANGHGQQPVTPTYPDTPQHPVADDQYPDAPPQYPVSDQRPVADQRPVTDQRPVDYGKKGVMPTPVYTPDEPKDDVMGGYLRIGIGAAALGCGGKDCHKSWNGALNLKVAAGYLFTENVGVVLTGTHTRELNHTRRKSMDLHLSQTSATVGLEVRALDNRLYAMAGIGGTAFTYGLREVGKGREWSLTSPISPLIEAEIGAIAFQGENFGLGVSAQFSKGFFGWRTLPVETHLQTCSLNVVATFQ